MKKTLIIGALIAGSLSAYSQGTISYFDRLSDVTIHIFAPQVATPSVEVTGDQNGATGVTADLYMNNGTDGNYAGGAVQGAGVASTVTTGGATVYTGGAIGNTNPGNATPAGAFNYNNGSDYTVELYAAPGLNAALSALSAVSQYTANIYTSSTIGGAFRNTTVASDPGIPNTAGGSATIALYAWYNGNGNIVTGLTLAQAQAAGDPWGVSPLDNISSLGGTGSPPSATPNLEGLESFSLVTTPEPSTIALGVIGASTLLFRRRK